MGARYATGAMLNTPKQYKISCQFIVSVKLQFKQLKLNIQSIVLISLHLMIGPNKSTEGEASLFLIRNKEPFKLYHLAIEFFCPTYMVFQDNRRGIDNKVILVPLVPRKNNIMFRLS